MTSDECPSGTVSASAPSSGVHATRADPVALRRDGEVLDVLGQRAHRQLLEEAAAGQELPGARRDQPHRRHAEQRRPGPALGRAHHDQLADALVAAELLDVVEPDETAHRVTDDVDLLHRRLRQDRFDLAVDQERRGADVADVERAEVEREDAEAVVVESALEDVHRAARPEIAVDQQHRRTRFVDGVEERLALDAIAAREVANVRQRVARTIEVVSDRRVDAAQPNARPLE